MLELFVVEDVPRARPNPLREVVLVPRNGRRRDVEPFVGVDAGPAAVQLRERDEVLLSDARRRRRHRAPVELAEPRRDRRAAVPRVVEPGTVAPWIGAEQQAALLGKPPREPA